MKAFAEFYTDSTGWNGTDFSGPKTLVPLCGSDGYTPLDGRLSTANMHHLAREKTWSHFKPHVRAYRLFRGDLRTAHPMSEIVTVRGAA